MNRIISDYLYLSKRIYPSICLSLWPCIHTYLSIYLSIHPHKSTYLCVCPCFHTHLFIYLSISHLHLCVCACLSIPSLIYLAAYPCIILLCIYVPIHYRSTYVSVRPSIQAQTQQSISVCLSHLSTYPSTHTNVPILLCVSVYPYLSVPPPPPMHLMISIGSVTDCSERSKLAVPSLVTWGPRVGTGSFMRALPVTDWHTATERRCCSPPPPPPPPPTSPRDPKCPSPVDEVNEARPHTQGRHWMCWGHARSCADSSTTPPILEQSNSNGALMTVHASSKWACQSCAPIFEMQRLALHA